MQCQPQVGLGNLRTAWAGEWETKSQIKDRDGKAPCAEFCGVVALRLFACLLALNRESSPGRGLARIIGCS
jgi:hypothetical protein